MIDYVLQCRSPYPTWTRTEVGLWPILLQKYVLRGSVGRYWIPPGDGVAALISAAPALHPYTLPLCLGILALLTLANLRGTTEAGRLFALPTYLFIGCFLVVIAIGQAYALEVREQHLDLLVDIAARLREGGGHPHPVVPPPPTSPTSRCEACSGWWLLLRAFASGCTAMTGIEAVSNGVNAFRQRLAGRACIDVAHLVVDEPQVSNARPDAGTCRSSSRWAIPCWFSPANRLLGG